MPLALLRRTLAGLTTVYKTTKAMRVLSMSLHASTKKLCAAQELYTRTLDTTIHRFTSPVLQKPTIAKKPFILFIGSQKGLCGSHNQEIASVARRIVKHEAEHDPIYAVIGKKLHGLIEHLAISPIVLPGLTKHNHTSLCASIVSQAHNTGCTYLVIVYAQSKNLFVRSVRAPSIAIHEQITLKDTVFTGHFSPLDLEQYLAENVFANFIKTALLEAFLAEQAARFTAMDAASNNAAESIAKRRIAYNKLRQSLITRELQDLVANWTFD